MNMLPQAEKRIKQQMILRRCSDENLADDRYMGACGQRSGAVCLLYTSGIRTDVPAGEWSFKTCKQVSPFGNVACLMSVTGKQIQDALEFGRCV